MAKVLKEAEITTAKARSRLETGEHARRLDAEAHLFYRKGVRSGVWFVRWRNHGAGANYKQASLGPANDVNDKPTDGLLTFQQAERFARERVEHARAEAKAAADGTPITVRIAVEAYIADRDARDSRRKGRPVRSDASRRLSLHLLGQEQRGKREEVSEAPLARIMLHALKEADLLEWRNQLPFDMKDTTKQRLINDLKAALNGAYSAHRDRLAANISSVIKHGLKSLKHREEAEPIARENQILSDAQIASLINAAREIDADQKWEGDLFRLVVLLAATGARFSQIARMKVGDVQYSRGRVMVPTSRKGHGTKAASTPVPVGKDILDAILSVVTSRPNDATLLERWRSKQTGPAKWERTGRGAWINSSELVRPWNDIRESAGLNTAIPYALRHSSIVRGIRANLPIRLVAAMHDTSVQMIERHYSKWIVDGLEDLAAQAVVPLIPNNAGDNVIPLELRK